MSTFSNIIPNLTQQSRQFLGKSLGAKTAPFFELNRLAKTLGRNIELGGNNAEVNDVEKQNKKNAISDALEHKDMDRIKELIPMPQDMDQVKSSKTLTAIYSREVAMHEARAARHQVMQEHNLGDPNDPQVRSHMKEMLSHKNLETLKETDPEAYEKWSGIQKEITSNIVERITGLGIKPSEAKAKKGFFEEASELMKEEPELYGRKQIQKPKGPVRKQNSTPTPLPQKNEAPHTHTATKAVEEEPLPQTQEHIATAESEVNSAKEPEIMDQIEAATKNAQSIETATKNLNKKLSQQAQERKSHTSTEGDIFNASLQEEVLETQPELDKFIEQERADLNKMQMKRGIPEGDITTFEALSAEEKETQTSSVAQNRAEKFKGRSPIRAKLSTLDDDNEHEHEQGLDTGYPGEKKEAEAEPKRRDILKPNLTPEQQNRLGERLAREEMERARELER